MKRRWEAISQEYQELTPLIKALGPVQKTLEWECYNQSKSSKSLESATQYYKIKDNANRTK